MAWWFGSMSLTHCYKYTEGVKLFYPSSIAPNNISNISQVTSKSKFGIGSLYCSTLVGQVLYTGLSSLPSVEGSIHFWLYKDTGKTGNLYIRLRTDATNNNNRTQLYMVFNATNIGQLGCVFYNASGTIVINQPSNPATLIPGTWNYAELNWSFDRKKVYAYINSTQVLNYTMTATYPRTATCERIYIDVPYADGNQEFWLDDICIRNNMQHLSGEATIDVPVTNGCTIPAYTKSRYRIYHK